MKHFPSDDHLIHSYDLFSWWCIDFARRKKCWSVYQQFHGFHYCPYRKHVDCIHFKQYFLKINKTKPAILVDIPVNVWMLDFKLSWWAEKNIIKVILSSIIAKLTNCTTIQCTRLHSPHPFSFRFSHCSENY